MLLRGWLGARLERTIRPVEPAGELIVAVGSDEVRVARAQQHSPSELLSGELDRFGRDRIYEEAVRNAATAAA
jgi:hypothetical protein